MQRPFACMGASPDSGNFLLCGVSFFIYLYIYSKSAVCILDVSMYLYRDRACAAYIHVGIDLKYWISSWWWYKTGWMYYEDIFTILLSPLPSYHLTALLQWNIFIWKWLDFDFSLVLSQIKKDKDFLKYSIFEVFLKLAHWKYVCHIQYWCILFKCIYSYVDVQ